MTNDQAKSRAKKLLGKNFYIRNSGFMSSPERREKAKHVVKEARNRRDEIDKEVQRRLNELDWYQALQKERRECLATIHKTEGDQMHYRFHVGKQTSFGFNEILGSGDTWEEAFSEAEGKV